MGRGGGRRGWNEGAMKEEGRMGGARGKKMGRVEGRRGCKEGREGTGGKRREGLEARAGSFVLIIEHLSTSVNL